MSLDIWLTETRPTTVYNANITHNLNEMAQACGLYECLWHPEEIGISEARQMIPFLEAGLAKLKKSPAKYKKFNSPNGWGKYENFVHFVEDVLNACRSNPNSKVNVSV